MHEVVDTVMALDADSSVRAIVVTGRGKAFAAGADIKEMASLTQQEVRDDGTIQRRTKNALCPVVLFVLWQSTSSRA